METISIELTVVSACFVGECAYNAHGGCHARAITIGNGVHPGCDTCLTATPHARSTERRAGVGACKMSACWHNDDYACTAEKIAVGHGAEGACCLTFQQRALAAAPARDRPHT